MTGGASSPAKLKLMDRRAEAIELRRAGHTYREIAAIIQVKLKLPKYNQMSAWEDVRHEIKDLVKRTDTDTSSIRAFELSRIDRLIRAAWVEAIQGSVQHIKAVAQLLKLKSDITGIMAPKELLLNVTELDNAIEIELARVAGFAQSTDVGRVEVEADEPTGQV